MSPTSRDAQDHTTRSPEHELVAGGASAEAADALARAMVSPGAEEPTVRTPLVLFDYGVGNLHSIQKALERSGGDVTITRDAADLLDAAAIVLPGVGAFGACMEPLLPVRSELRQRLQDGTPCLGICIGMHLLTQRSEEDPGIPGIGLFDAEVRRFDPRDGKVPHMGWNATERPPAAAHTPSTAPTGDPSRASATGGRPKTFGDTAFRHLLPLPGEHLYFVHSYYVPAAAEAVIRSTTYGTPFAAVMAKQNTLGVQFHPEKSSDVGLRLIDRWVRATAKLCDP